MAVQKKIGDSLFVTWKVSNLGNFDTDVNVVTKLIRPDGKVSSDLQDVVIVKAGESVTKKKGFILRAEISKITVEAIDIKTGKTIATAEWENPIELITVTEAKEGKIKIKEIKIDINAEWQTGKEITATSPCSLGVSATFENTSNEPITTNVYAKFKGDWNKTIANQVITMQPGQEGYLSVGAKIREEHKGKSRLILTFDGEDVYTDIYVTLK